MNDRTKETSFQRDSEVTHIKPKFQRGERDRKLRNITQTETMNNIIKCEMRKIRDLCLYSLTCNTTEAKRWKFTRKVTLTEITGYGIISTDGHEKLHY